MFSNFFHVNIVGIMTIDEFLALIIFGVITSITPGPNNFMLLASGLNVGLQRSLPHAIGIAVGFFTLLMGVGLGLGAVLITFPTLHLVLKIVGAAYLLYFAWRIATSSVVNEEAGRDYQPMTFFGAAAFQWANPKAWFMAITAMALYANHQEELYLSVFLVAAVFAMVNFPCVTLWAGFGQMLRRFFTKRKFVKYFNITSGVLLVLSLWPILR